MGAASVLVCLLFWRPLAVHSEIHTNTLVLWHLPTNVCHPSWILCKTCGFCPATSGSCALRTSSGTTLATVFDVGGSVSGYSEIRPTVCREVRRSRHVLLSTPASQRPAGGNPRHKAGPDCELWLATRLDSFLHLEPPLGQLAVERQFHHSAAPECIAHLTESGFPSY